MKNADLSIYIATHEQKITVKDSYHIPIQTGAALSDKNIAIIKDNTGDNISSRNQSFSELTALYWIWKNSTSQYVGLSHYRRYFMIDTNDIISYLYRYDIIVPPAYFFRKSLYQEYVQYHNKDDLDLLIRYLQIAYPEMLPTFKHILSQNRLIPYNMFITQKQLLNTYCNWLFPILFYLEKEIELAQRDTYQKRVFGFLSERLFTLYLAYTKPRIITCPVMIPEKSSILGAIKYSLGKEFNRVYFHIIK